MAIETYSDATPDSNISADQTAITSDQNSLANDLAVEQASPNTAAGLVGEDQHLRDLITVDIDDLVIQERQRQIDLVTGTYGTANSSDLTAANEALTADKEQKTNDQNLP